MNASFILWLQRKPINASTKWSCCRNLPTRSLISSIFSGTLKPTQSKSVNDLLHFIKQIFFVSGTAYRKCLESGEWFFHPVFNKTWSNYTTCVNLEELSVSTFCNFLFYTLKKVNGLTTPFPLRKVVMEFYVLDQGPFRISRKTNFSSG